MDCDFIAFNYFEFVLLRLFYVLIIISISLL